jgi:hypothetical protein
MTVRDVYIEAGMTVVTVRDVYVEADMTSDGGMLI